MDTIKFEKKFRNSNNLGPLINIALKSFNQPPESLVNFIQNEMMERKCKKLPNFECNYVEELWKDYFPYPFLFKETNQPKAKYLRFMSPSSNYYGDDLTKSRVRNRNTIFNRDTVYLMPSKQHFAVPSTIISYINHSYSAFKATYKLYKTCKYFFYYRRELLCNHLDLKPDLNFWSNNLLALESSFDNFSNIKSLWLNGSLRLLETTDVFLAELKSKISFFDPVSLGLSFCELTWNDWNFLVSSKNLKSLTSYDVGYHHADMRRATFDEIMNTVPNIVELRYVQQIYTYIRISCMYLILFLKLEK